MVLRTRILGSGQSVYKKSSISMSSFLLFCIDILSFSAYDMNQKENATKVDSRSFSTFSLFLIKAYSHFNSIYQK